MTEGDNNNISKFALLIGNIEYNDEKLSELKKPESDVNILSEVLDDPKIGEFTQITKVIDQNVDTVRRSIARFFQGKKRDDMLLMYFAGHGVLDSNGRLHLAFKDTEYGLLRATGISASYIANEMDECRSRRQILILDCCHSGAFARGMRGSTRSSVGTGEAFKGNGQGRMVLTASDATQYAWEGDNLIGEYDNSVFTHHLVTGLRTGDADTNGDGLISFEELYDYVYNKVIADTPKQTPAKWTYKQQGEIYIAKAPKKRKPRPKDLPVPQLSEVPKQMLQEGIKAISDLIREISIWQELLDYLMSARLSMNALVFEANRLLSLDHINDEDKITLTIYWERPQHEIDIFLFYADNAKLEVIGEGLEQWIEKITYLKQKVDRAIQDNNIMPKYLNERIVSLERALDRYTYEANSRLKHGVLSISALRGQGLSKLLDEIG